MCVAKGTLNPLIILVLVGRNYIDPLLTKICAKNDFYISFPVTDLN